MKINGFRIQFNHKMAGYKDVKDVPYWRVYLVRKTRVKEKLSEEQYKLWGNEYYVHYTTEVLAKSTRNYKYDAAIDICSILNLRNPLQKGEFFVAYPRKGRTNRVL